ncbi:MAG: aminoacyl-tRNA hydrolase, partial [Chloroflexota bacterium]
AARRDPMVGIRGRSACAAAGRTERWERRVRIVVGLGNPGAQYAGTRHNVGWMVCDRIAERAGFAGRGKERDAAVVLRGRWEELDLLLVKPLTYMNDSGSAVRKVLARERVPLDSVLVVTDDFSLPLGRLRLREEGSAGGHNGLRSIIAEMGTQKFARLRVGIGAPSAGAVGHVLTRFAPSEADDLERVLRAASDAVRDWARDGTARAANRWNPWTLPLGADAAGAGPATGAGPADASADPRAPGPDGIVRTRTGWRKVLPAADHRHDR